jgi:hypothetical protein
VQGELEDSQRVVVSGFTASIERQSVQMPSAGPDDETSYASDRVGSARFVHTRIALIVVVVPREDDVGAGVVQGVPELLHVH